MKIIPTAKVARVAEKGGVLKDPKEHPFTRTMAHIEALMLGVSKGCQMEVIMDLNHPHHPHL